MRSLLTIFAPLLVAYGLALRWCVERWNAPTMYFQHGWLVPVVAVAVVWSRRGTWRARPASRDRRGWWLLGPALLLLAIGTWLRIDSLAAGSLVLAIPGAAWLALGRARLTGLWPVLWLSVFLVPAPIYVEGRSAFVLKELAIGAGARLANLLGADVARVGAELQLVGGGGALYVADACGGLRSLLAMTMLGYCLAFLSGAADWRRRLALLAVVVPLAVGANIVRIAALCLQARWWGVPFAEGTGHTLANVAEWGVDLLALLAVDRLVSRWLGVAGHVAVAPAVAIAAPVPARRGVATGVALWLFAAAIVAVQAQPAPFVGHDRAVKLPDTLAGYRLVPRNAADEAAFQANLPRYCELLGTDDFVWQSYFDAAGARINLVALFHDDNWKSVHPPRICIEGSNMDIHSDAVEPAAWLDPQGSVSRIVAQSRDDHLHYVTLTLYGTKDWSSGSYTDFTWHHLPLALLRRNDSGFMLRVETPIGAGETPALAEARCRTFLTALLPAARTLLP